MLCSVSFVTHDTFWSNYIFSCRWFPCRSLPFPLTEDNYLYHYEQISHQLKYVTDIFLVIFVQEFLYSNKIHTCYSCLLYRYVTGGWQELREQLSSIESRRKRLVIMRYVPQNAFEANYRAVVAIYLNLYSRYKSSTILFTARHMFASVVFTAGKVILQFRLILAPCCITEEQQRSPTLTDPAVRFSHCPFAACHNEPWLSRWDCPTMKMYALGGCKSSAAFHLFTPPVSRQTNY